MELGAPLMEPPDIDTAHNIPREKEGIIFRILSYFITIIVFAVPFWVFMKVFSRVKIIGKYNLTKAKLPFLFVSNHVSMLDDAFLDPLLFIPRGLWDYKFMPYHTPERKNFYRGPIFSWIMEHVKCIPLTRGMGIYQPGIQQIIGRLKGGNSVHIYPEGTRTRTGDIGRGKPGVGRIIHQAKCSVIPCYHSGLNEVLPLGSKTPKPGKRITVIIGKPISFERYNGYESNVRTWQSIADEVIQVISDLRDKLNPSSI